MRRPIEVVNKLSNGGHESNHKFLMAEEEIVRCYKESAKRHEVCSLSGWFKCVKICILVFH